MIFVPMQTNNYLDVVPALTTCYFPFFGKNLKSYIVTSLIKQGFSVNGTVTDFI